MTRQQVPNRDLGLDTARLNLLTNGGFEIWQRGLGPFTVSGAFCADRWQIYAGAPSSVSITREPTAVRSGYSLRPTYTHGAGGIFILYQDVESVNLRTLPVQFSLQALSPVTGSAIVVQSYNGSAYSTLGSANVPINASTFSFVSCGGAVPTDSVTLRVSFQTSVASHTAYLDDAMLVVGTAPANYSPLHPADDLARCQRYYEVIGGVAAGYPSCYGNSMTNAAGIYGIYALGWKVTKAVTPTLTKAGTWSVANCSQPSFDRATIHGCRMYASSLAAGSFETYPADATCVLIAEANP